MQNRPLKKSNIRIKLFFIYKDLAELGTFEWTDYSHSVYLKWFSCLYFLFSKVCNVSKCYIFLYLVVDTVKTVHLKMFCL